MEKHLEAKIDCISILKTIFENFILGNIVCQKEIVPNQVWESLKGVTYRFPPVDGENLSLPLEVIGQKLTDDKQRQPFCNHFQSSLRRAFVAECYEIVKLYCVKSNQDSKFTVLPWYQFPRLIRNLVSHTDAGYLTWPQKLLDKGITKVTWRHRTLDSSMVGQEIGFTNAEAALLYKDLLEFVDKQLQ